MSRISTVEDSQTQTIKNKRGQELASCQLRTHTTIMAAASPTTTALVVAEDEGGQPDEWASEPQTLDELESRYDTVLRSVAAAEKGGGGGQAHLRWANAQAVSGFMALP